MAKHTRGKSPATLVVLEPEYAMHVWFTGVIFEPEALRRFAHLVVDYLADRARHAGLLDTMAMDLNWIAQDFVVKHMADLIRHACVPRKGVSHG